MFIALTASMEAERACTPFLDKAALREFGDLFFLVDININEFLSQPGFARLEYL